MVGIAVETDFSMVDEGVGEEIRLELHRYIDGNTPMPV